MIIDKDPQKVERVTAAFLKIKKFDIGELQKAGKEEQRVIRAAVPSTITLLEEVPACRHYHPSLPGEAFDPLVLEK